MLQREAPSRRAWRNVCQTRVPAGTKPMPERTETCGGCGASKTFPDGDWNAVQAPAVRAWEREHTLDAHDGKEVFSRSLEPNPFFDRG
jgi:hypothetical protein